MVSGMRNDEIETRTEMGFFPSINIETEPTELPGFLPHASAARAYSGDHDTVTEARGI